MSVPAEPRPPARPTDPPPHELETARDDSTPVSTPPSLPEQFGRYRILRLLGRGGMGAVYLAEDTHLFRQVALKVPHFRAEDGHEVLERFYREARTAGRIQHPNICPVHDVNEIAGVHYLTMAFIEGKPLSALVGDYARQPAAVAAALVRTLARAMDEVHRFEVVHRDLKPSNVLMNHRGEPVITDFGLARCIRTGVESQTTPGLIIGTPAYMAPEQARGEVDRIGPATDVYALGVMLYELLTGKVPFAGPGLAVLSQLLSDTPALPRSVRHEIDPRLEALCLRAMAREMSHRFPSMAELAAALDEWLRAANTPRASGGRKAPEDVLQAASALRSPDDSGLGALLAGEVLDNLRTWGWDLGLSRVRNEALGARDNSTREALEGVRRWLAGEVDLDAMPAAFAGLPQSSTLRAWAEVGQAYAARNRHEFDRALTLLDDARRLGGASDPALKATVCHLRGTVLFHTNRATEGLAAFHEALRLFGRDHAMVGRVLDSIGMVHAHRDRFHAAREFYQQALAWKERFGDEPGIALTHGHLGLLYLDRGDLDQAEEHFDQDLRLVEKAQHGRGQAVVYNHLGRTALARAQREIQGGRRAASRKEFGQAAQWLDESIRLNRAGNHRVPTAFACKDRARVALAQGNLDEAEEYTRQAESLFREADFAEGAAHLHRLWGCIRRAQGRHDESARLLRQALAHFDHVRERSEAAHTQRELARTLQESGAAARLVTQAFLDALERAEDCGRAELVRLIEEDLQAADLEAYWRHVFHRVRGRGVDEDTSALSSGENEVATALFFNLQGFAAYCQGMDASDVMLTLNEMLADLGSVLERHRMQVTAYLGGGFMALARGAGHATRAVLAGMDLLELVAELNCPRQILGLRELPAQVGLATGPVCVGNIGTYHRMDFTAVGAAVNLASRLMRQAGPSGPCVSRETWEQVRDRFEFRPDDPRVVEFKEIGPREVWDVIGRKEELRSLYSRM